MVLQRALCVVLFGGNGWSWECGKFRCLEEWDWESATSRSPDWEINKPTSGSVVELSVCRVWVMGFVFSSHLHTWNWSPRSLCDRDSSTETLRDRWSGKITIDQYLRECQGNWNKKQFIELSLKSLVQNRLTLTVPLPTILVIYNNAIM